METVFISSVQKELAEERRALKNYIEGDALLRRFFDVFLFEDLPAADRRVDDVYLDQVDRCGIYLGIFGDQYGYEDAEGLSPTEREFNRATEQGKTRLIYVKGADDKNRHAKMQVLIRKAGDQLIRRRVTDASDLIPAVYASLVQHLEDRELIRTGPFDATFCRNATLDDLDEERIVSFVGLARRARGFPLPEDSKPRDVLTHLNLLDRGRPTHSAILLFGNKPQRFLISSEVKCAHFHGTEVAKPIPSYQVYKGTVFELVDQAVDFVMSKIDRWIGTRSESAQAPTVYELPREVVAEAIVNAVAHRDYVSNGSVQVMLFADRLEVWNPGTLPPSLTLEKLRQPHGSVPHNPLLAEPLYLAKYIERMGTGTGDMINRCRDAGLAEPEFDLTDGFVATIRRKATLAPEKVVSPDGTKLALSRHQVEILRICRKDSALVDLMAVTGRSDRTKFRDQVLKPLLEAELIEMTIPDKPRSSKQKYRLTDKGLAMLEGGTE